MEITTGRFKDPSAHYDGWFKVYKFGGYREIWFGRRWIGIEWR